MQGVPPSGGPVMQLELSYKLIVTPDTSNHVIQDPLEQVLEIQSRDLSKSSPKLMSIQLNNAIKEMLDAAAHGDSFNVQIVGKYEYPGLPSYEKSYPDTPYVYIPKPIY